MTAPEPPLAPWREVSRRYRALFLDAYGVLRDDAGPLPAALDALRELRAHGPPAFVITNDASRDAPVLAAAYEGLLAPEQFISAGLLACEHLAARHAGQAVAYLGPPACAACLDPAGCELLDFQALGGADLERLSAVALMDEAGWDWQRELERLVNLARRRPEMELLAPNPDLVFPRRGGEVGLGSGALAALLARTLGREPRAFGKPAAEIFARGLRAAREALGEALGPGEVLMVGDTLETDILGARRAGLATALVLSGNTTPARLEEAVARAGVRPDHLLAGLGR